MEPKFPTDCDIVQGAEFLGVAQSALTELLTQDVYRLTPQLVLFHRHGGHGQCIHSVKTLKNLQMHEPVSTLYANTLKLMAGEEPETYDYTTTAPTKAALEPESLDTTL